jgi:Tfp pilus assembly protein PilV
MTQDHQSESGMVLFELLIAMTLIVGSITVAHTVYAKLVMKTMELEKSHAAWIHQKNQHEIMFYLNQFKKQQPNNLNSSKR